jgi:hypothetical protein
MNESRLIRMWEFVLGFLPILVLLTLLASCQPPEEEEKPVAKSPPAQEDPPGQDDPGGDPGSTGGGGTGLSFELPSLKSKVLGLHDSQARKIKLEHNAASIECSHDDGVSYASCDANDAVIFTEDDYDSGRDLYVKVNDGGADAIYTINPKSELPGLSFLHCHENIANDLSAVAFEDLVLNAITPDPDPFVICLAAGVTIGSELDFWTPIYLNNFEMIGTHQDPPTFYVPDIYIFQGYARLANMKILDDKDGMVQAISFGGTGDFIFEGLEVETQNQAFGFLPLFNPAEIDEANIIIKDSVVFHDGVVGALQFSLNGVNANMTIENSVIEATASPAFAVSLDADAVVAINNSKLITSGDQPNIFALGVHQVGSVSINNSQIESYKGAPILVSGENSNWSGINFLMENSEVKSSTDFPFFMIGPGSNVTIQSTDFVRTAESQASEFAMINNPGGAYTDTSLSVNFNTWCSEDSASSWWTDFHNPLIGSTFSGSFELPDFTVPVQCE